MKKLFISIYFLLISNAALAGSCPMLWGKIDSSINNVADEELKLKIQELRDAGWYTRPVDKLASTEFTFTRFSNPQQ